MSYYCTLKQAFALIAFLLNSINTLSVLHPETILRTMGTQGSLESPVYLQECLWVVGGNRRTQGQDPTKDPGTVIN